MDKKAHIVAVQVEESIGNAGERVTIEKIDEVLYEMEIGTGLKARARAILLRAFAYQAYT